MLQQKKPSDYVISTGKQYTVKQFINLTLKELNMKFIWRGKGINEKCFFRDKCIIETEKAYYRPLEVDTLLGDSSRAKKELKWKPKINIASLIKDMIYQEMKILSNDRS